MALKRQIVRSFFRGGMLVISWFLLCDWISRLPVSNDVSLSLAFRPWWRHWPFAIAIFHMPLLALSAFHARRYLLSLRA